MSKIVVFGDGPWADLAHLYLTLDSPHEVVAFTVDGADLREGQHRGLPVVPFEEIRDRYPAEEFALFIPIGFKKMNHVRAEKYDQAKAWGYRLISYVSSKVTRCPNFVCGDNCFIIEDNTIQPFAEIGNDVVMWKGNYLGEHSIVKDHVTITSQVVVSGSCVIEPYCFVGVHATIRDRAVIGRETLVEAGAVILRDTREFEVCRAPSAGSLRSEARSLTRRSYRVGSREGLPRRNPVLNRRAGRRPRSGSACSGGSTPSVRSGRRLPGNRPL
jgi:sugar O-acyltransferase (sialic acid O-acetyltransferase NeuD family)